jgi:hypothetical protein
MPTASFVATAVIRNVCAMLFISATASFVTTAAAVADADDTTTRCCRYVGRFMAQMTTDGRDGTVDCRRHCALFGHAVAKSDLPVQGEIQ